MAESKENLQNNVNNNEKNNNDNDSDDENDFFFNINHQITEIIEEIPLKRIKKEFFKIEEFLIILIQKNIQKLKNIKIKNNYEKKYKELTLLLLNGKYLEIILNENNILNYKKLLTCLEKNNNENIIEVIYQLIQLKINTITYYNSNDNESDNQIEVIPLEWLAYECLIIGYAYFELFCQSNYTGPELSSSQLLELLPTDEINLIISKNSIQNLECDGIYPFRICQIPHTLLIGRIILQYLSDPAKLSWQHGIQLDSNGTILPKLSDNLDLNIVKSTKNFGLIKNWLSLRACIIHARLLQQHQYIHLPTMWKECEDLISIIDQNIQQFQQDLIEVYENNTESKELNELTILDNSKDSVIVPISQIQTLYYLEKGLCYHYFDYQDKVTYIFIYLYLFFFISKLNSIILIMIFY